MSRVVWKNNHIISIETRKGIFTLGQMSKSPYLIFFNIFRKKDEWGGIDLNKIPVLFFKAVTNQFLRNSNIVKQKKVMPKTDFELPNKWIRDRSYGSRAVVVWPGTPQEKKIIIIGEGNNMLVEIDKTQHKHKYDGIYDKVLMPSIKSSDTKTIGSYEIDNLCVFPETNERLYLCYLFGKNVDPMKDLEFNRPLPPEYATYVDIISGASEDKKKAKEIEEIFNHKR